VLASEYDKVSKMLDAKETLTGAIAVVNIKQRHYTEMLLDSCPNIIVLFDKEGHFNLVTQEFFSLTSIPNFSYVKGCTYEKILGKYFEAEDMRAFDEAFKSVLNSGVEIKYDVTADFAKSDMSRNYSLELRQSVTKSKNDGEVSGVLMVMVDITDLALEKNRAEIASRAKSDFLAKMSHELRTPMNAVMSMASLGVAAENIERKDYCLKKITDASHHLLDVINDVLDMSKIEAEKFELSILEFDFEKLLQRIEGIINFRTEEKKQQFDIELDRSIPNYLIGDDHKLAQVLLNLLGNAIKFTPEQGKITLKTELFGEENGYVALKVTVMDTGIGISEEKIESIFSPFQQAESGTSRAYGGTGLGLAISKNIVEMMDGEIWIESGVGKGTNVCFIVKLMRGTGSADKSDESDLPQVEDITGVLKGFRVLLVEDMEINREIVLAVLEPTEAKIECATNGAEAVDIFRQDPELYDMILMDLQMPVMDGYEATKAIRRTEHPNAKNIPIVAMTANVFKEDVNRTRDVGMNGHLGKPIDFGELIDMMRRYSL